jgi:protein TonB
LFDGLSMAGGNGRWNADGARRGGRWQASAIAVALHGVLIVGLLWGMRVAPAPQERPPLIVQMQLASTLDMHDEPAPLPMRANEPPKPHELQPLEMPLVVPTQVERSVAASEPQRDEAKPAEPAPVEKPTAAPVAPKPVEPQEQAPRFDAAYLNNPAPAYPSAARQLGEQGRVLLWVRVSREGSPLEVQLRQSSGSSRLDRAAVDAVQRWRFVPAHRGAEQIESSVLVPVDFKLNG